MVQFIAEFLWTERCTVSTVNDGDFDKAKPEPPADFAAADDDEDEHEIEDGIVELEEQGYIAIVKCICQQLDVCHSSS